MQLASTPPTPPPFIVSCCREVSPGGGGRGREYYREGNGLGEARPTGSYVTAPEEDNGQGFLAADTAGPAASSGCSPFPFWLVFNCRAGKAPQCQVKSPRILFPHRPGGGAGVAKIRRNSNMDFLGKGE